MPSGVKSVGASSFKNCKKITQFTLPASVETVGAAILSGCEKLTKVSLSLDHAPPFGYFFGSDNNVSSVFPPNLKSVTVLGNSIGENAFSGCVKLTKVVVLESVNSIGVNAFLGCTGLTQVIFEDKQGWEAGEVVLTETELAGASTCAQYVNQTYVSVAWTKKGA